MGDAFTLKQCSVGYLKTELIRLHRLQHRYAEELQQRGLSVLEESDGEIAFQPVLVQNAESTEAERDQNRDTQQLSAFSTGQKELS